MSTPAPPRVEGPGAEQCAVDGYSTSTAPPMTSRESEQSGVESTAIASGELGTSLFKNERVEEGGGWGSGVGYGKQVVRYL